MTTARELSDRLASLLRREHEAMADFLVALAEFFRNTAARLVRRYPEIVEPLRDGRLCLTSLAHLAKVLTAENKAELLPRFFQRSKSEAKEIVAEILPEAAPPRRAVITVVQPAPALNLGPTPASASHAELPPSGGFPKNLPGANSSATDGGLLPQGEQALRPPTSGAPCSRVTVGGANTRSSPAASVDPPTASSSDTSCRAPRAGSRPRRTFAANVRFTISIGPSSSLASRSWTSTAGRERLR